MITIWYRCFTRNCWTTACLLIVEDGVKTIEEKQITLASGKTVPADAVILAIGVAPETGLQRQPDWKSERPAVFCGSQLPQAIKISMRLVMPLRSFDRVTGKPSRLALAGPALRQARAAADAMYGIPMTTEVLSVPCALRVFGLNAAATVLMSGMPAKPEFPAILFM